MLSTVRSRTITGYTLVALIAAIEIGFALVTRAVVADTLNAPHPGIQIAEVNPSTVR